MIWSSKALYLLTFIFIGSCAREKVTSQTPPSRESRPLRPLTAENIASGKALIEKNGCNSCHSVDGSNGVGPTLLGSLTPGRQVKLANQQEAEANFDFFKEKCFEPSKRVMAGYQPVMPSYKGTLSNEQVEQIADYIRSLSNKK